MAGYPQPPPLISKYIDAQLRENAALLGAAKSHEAPQSIRDCVTYLEAAHASLLHLGRLADVQTIRHGLPPASTDSRKDSGLSPRDELLQTAAMSLTAYHMLPPRQEAPSRPDKVVDLTAAARQPTPVHSNEGQTPSDVTPSVTTQAGAGHAAAAHARSTGRTGGRSATRGQASVAAVPDPIATEPTPNLPDVQSSDVMVHPQVTDGNGEAVTEGADGTARTNRWDSAAPSRTRWSVEEIAMFEAGVAKFGLSKPSQIAAFMGTRNGEQVRERIKWWKRKVGILKKWPPRDQAGAASAADDAVS